MGNPFYEKAKRLREAPEKICKEAIPKIEPDVKESLFNAINNFYSFPQGIYSRTGNFRNWDANVGYLGNGNGVIVLDNDSMSAYPGFWGLPLGQEGAMNIMFLGGNHGYGRFNIGSSTPPHELVEKDLASGFNGKLQQYVREAATHILCNL